MPSELAPAPEGDVRRLIGLAAQALDERQAVDMVLLDLSAVSQALSYFLIVTGSSTVQRRALEEGARERLEAAGFAPLGVESSSDRWKLLDYGALVIHIMSPEARAFYDLEGLWADARRLSPGDL